MIKFANNLQRLHNVLHADYLKQLQQGLDESLQSDQGLRRSVSGIDSFTPRLPAEDLEFRMGRAIEPSTNFPDFSRAELESFSPDQRAAALENAIKAQKGAIGDLSSRALDSAITGLQQYSGSVPERPGQLFPESKLRELLESDLNSQKALALRGVDTGGILVSPNLLDLDQALARHPMLMRDGGMGTLSRSHGANIRRILATNSNFAEPAPVRLGNREITFNSRPIHAGKGSPDFPISNLEAQVRRLYDSYAREEFETRARGTLDSWSKNPANLASQYAPGLHDQARKMLSEFGQNNLMPKPATPPTAPTPKTPRAPRPRAAAKAPAMPKPKAGPAGTPPQNNLMPKPRATTADVDPPPSLFKGLGDTLKNIDWSRIFRRGR
jgi:hypothetical protein